MLTAAFLANLAGLHWWEVVMEHKLVVVGSAGVGKSALTIQLVSQHFVEEYDPTLENSFRKRVVIDGEAGVLDILDTAEEQQPSTLVTEYIKHAHGIVLTYSITSRASFNEIQDHRSRVLRLRDDTPTAACVCMVLCGNKCDLADKREVPITEGQALAKQLNCRFVEISAKTGENLSEMFYDLVRDYRKSQANTGATHGSSKAGKQQGNKRCSLC